MAQHDSSLSGRWTNEEHQKFLLGIKLYGKNWRKIQEMISTRTCSQIRSHAQKYFLKLKKQNRDRSQNNLEESSLNDSFLPNDNSTGHAKEPDLTSYSYFMGKIVQYTRSHQNFDIWDALIDSGSRKETVTNVSSQEIQNQKSKKLQQSQILNCKSEKIEPQSK